MRRGAGVLHGWVPTERGDADRGLLPRRQSEQARPSARPQDARTARRSCVGCSSRRTSSSRTSGSAGSPGSGSTRRSSQRLNPRLVHLAISGYGRDRTRRRAARLRLRHPGDEWPHVDHRRPGRRRWRADEGRGRDQRRRHRDARGGQHPGGARRARARRGPGPGRRQRIDVSLLGATLASLVNQAQNAFVTGERARAPRQRAPEHRPVRDVPDRRRRDRGRRRVRASVAAAVRRAGRARAGHGSAVRDERRPRRTPRGPAADPGGRFRDATDRRPGWRRSTRPEIPCGPINDVVAAFASPEAVALGMTVEQVHPAWGVIRQVGVPVPAVRDAGVDPDTAADPRRGHRRDPCGTRV